MKKLRRLLRSPQVERTSALLTLRVSCSRLRQGQKEDWIQLVHTGGNAMKRTCTAVATAVSCLSLSLPLHAQDIAALLQQLKAAEDAAHSAAKHEPAKPNEADLVLNAMNRSTVRSPLDPNIVRSRVSKVTTEPTKPIAGGLAPRDIKLSPDDVRVTFTQHWGADLGWKWYLAPTEGPVLIPPEFNDQVSGALVPIGLMAQICEHDGLGEAGTGHCEDISPPGRFVGDKINDKGTRFWVTDKQSIFTFTSANPRVPSEVQFEFWYRSPGPGAQFSYMWNKDWYHERYEFDLPDRCANPDLWEGFVSKDKDGNPLAGWTPTKIGNRLTLELRVKPHFWGVAHKNKVIVGVRCQA
ncbi:hypothetical protein [Variovorax sp. J22R115]|uniref:hypothetical protein n=1 Tax=Variovorax sp. J22R115 TaxID=3053509 RepID=UPI002577BCD0|nr:hypothetical protein [Variovorax sp. J22R115]MDM0053919.1 hypothetical protein [Variovorax sp. J22R115]